MGGGGVVTDGDFEGSNAGVCDGKVAGNAA